jgi:secreted effector protein SseD
MKRVIALFLCAALAGCNSTSEPRESAANSGKAQSRANQQNAKNRTSANACADAVANQNKAATAGAVLGMAGSFAGFGGRGGMVASHVASTAGNAIAAGEMNRARASVASNCR